MVSMARAKVIVVIRNEQTNWMTNSTVRDLVARSSAVRQISSDVSRYLYFASPEELKELLLDSAKMHKYLT